MLQEIIASPSAELARSATIARAGAAANRAGASQVFNAYQQRRPANTLCQQRDDLDLFKTFFRAVGTGSVG